MKTVRFRHDPEPAEVQTRQRLLDALLSKRVPVKMLCGGRGLCATCHVRVVNGAEQLTPKTPRETLTLSVLSGAGAESRLACQSHVLGEGVQIELPGGLYVESFGQLEALIGRRTTEPVLHPVSGRVLILEGKIVTRSVVNQLQSLDVDLGQLSVVDATRR